MGKARDTDQIGELNGIGQGLMWLDNVPMDEAEAAFVYNSMYTSYLTQEKWKPMANKEATKPNEEMLAKTIHTMCKPYTPTSSTIHHYSCTPLHHAPLAKIRQGAVKSRGRVREAEDEDRWPTFAGGGLC
jgi:hypothetical protein